METTGQKCIIVKMGYSFNKFFITHKYQYINIIDHICLTKEEGQTETNLNSPFNSNLIETRFNVVVLLDWFLNLTIKMYSLYWFVEVNVEYY